MAVVQVIGPRAGTLAGFSDVEGFREYPIDYVVKVDDLADDDVIVRSADDGTTAIPDFNTTYAYGNSTDATAFLKEKRANRTSEGSLTWIVECLYTTATSVPLIIDTPLAQPPEIEWDAIEFREQITRDLDGKLLKNSAGDLLVHEDDVGYGVYRVTRNESAFSIPVALAYKNALNSDTFKGAPPGFAKMKPIRSRQLFASGITYFRTTYEIHFNDQGWDPPLFDTGLVLNIQKSGGGFERRGLMLKSWDPQTGRRGGDVMATEPQLLNGAGQEADIGVGGIPVPVDLKTHPNFQYRLKNKLPFKFFGLP